MRKPTRRSIAPPGRANGIAAITPERVIREGDPTEQILDVDRQGRGHRRCWCWPPAPAPEGPGPIITTIGQDRRRVPDSGRHRAGQPDATRTSTACPEIWSAADGPGCVAGSPCSRPLDRLHLCRRLSARSAMHLTAPALNRRCAGDDHVHPDRSHAQSRHPEVPSRPHRARRAAPGVSRAATPRHVRRSPKGCSTCRA